MKKWKSDSGQVLVLTAMTMSVMLGFIGLATDVGQLFHAKRNMQAAVDSAVIAAAITYKGDYAAGASSSALQTDMRNAATSALAENGIDTSRQTTCYRGAATPTTFTFSSPPSDGPNVGRSGFMEGILTVPQCTVFMGLSGYGTVNISVRAVAGIGGGNAKGCIYTLNKTAPDAMQYQGSFDVTAPGCEIDVASNNPNALQFTGGGGTLTAGSIAVTGGDGGQTGDSTPAPITNTHAVINDPFGGLEGPTPTDCSNGSFSWGESNTNTASNYALTSGQTSVTLSGIYTGPGTGNAICFSVPVTLSNVILGSGIYVFEQGATLSGSVVTAPGAGTTLDMYNGGLTIPIGGVSFGAALTCDPTTSSSCAATAQTDGLVAPTSGWTNGIAIMEPPGNTSEIQIQKGNATGNITGAIYAPSAELFLQDSGGDNNGGLSFVGDIVVDTLYDKTTTMTVYSYADVNPGTNPLKTVTLVE